MTMSTDTLQQTYTALQPIFEELEVERLKVRDQSLKNGALVGVGVIVLGMIAFRIFDMEAMFAVVGLGALLWWRLNQPAIQHYRQRFKNQVMRQLVERYDARLSYQPQGGISEQEFRASGIYPFQADRYRSEDLLVGAIGATTFRFSDVHAQYKTEYEDDGTTKTRWHTLFKGTFMVADFNKHFEGSTFVLPELSQRTFVPPKLDQARLSQLSPEQRRKLALEIGLTGFKQLGQMMQSSGMESAILSAPRPGQPVKLEDPEFEKLFVVHSTDQIEARYILSTSLMQRLVAFQRRVNGRVALSFVNSSLNIAIETTKDYFEPPSIWFGTARMTQEDLNAYMEELKFAEGVIDDLNLNLRLWSKR